jgi:hypothetical protein
MEALRRAAAAAAAAPPGGGDSLKPAQAAAASYGSFGGGDGAAAAHARPPWAPLHAAHYATPVAAAPSGRTAASTSTTATPAVTEAALDDFFVGAYDYWRGGGAVAIAAAAGAHVALTLVLAAVLPVAITFVDYAALAACHDAGSCGPLARFFTTAHVRNPRPAEALSALLAAAHAAHLAGLAWHALATVAAAWRMRRFYRAVLGVPDAAALTALSWDDVVRRLQGAVVARAAARRLAFHQASQQAARGGGGGGGGGSPASPPLPPVVPVAGPLGRVLARLVELQVEYEGHLERCRGQRAAVQQAQAQQRLSQRQARSTRQPSQQQYQQQPFSATKTGGGDAAAPLKPVGGVATAWLGGGALELTARRARAPTASDDPRPSLTLPGATGATAATYGSSATTSTSSSSGGGDNSMDALEAFLSSTAAAPAAAAPAAAASAAKGSVTPLTSDPRGVAQNTNVPAAAATNATAPQLPASALTDRSSDGSISRSSSGGGSATATTVEQFEDGVDVRVAVDASAAAAHDGDESPSQGTLPTSPSPSDEGSALLSPCGQLRASHTVAIGGHYAPRTATTGVAVVGDRTLVSPVSAQAVACRIMRYDNYLVALLDEGGGAGGGTAGGHATDGPVLRTSLRSTGGGGGTSDGGVCSPLLRLLLCRRRRQAYAHVPTSGEAPTDALLEAPPGPRLWLPFTDSLEWALRRVLLDPLLSPHRTLRAPFTAVDARAAAAHLRRRFIAAGLLGLAAAPVALLLRALAHVAAVSQEAHATRDVLGPRGWSPYALAALREYNELPHVFQRRMAAAAPAAARYLREFPPSPAVNAAARVVASLAGAALTLLLAAALVDDALLVHVSVGSHNLLFLSAALGGVLAGARALTSDAWHGTLQPEAALSELAAHLHFMPRRWWRRARSPRVRAEVAALFQYRAVLFLQDVAGAVTTPLALLCVLPGQAEALVAFLRAATVQREGLGAMCAAAVFDDERGSGAGDVGGGGSGSVSDADLPPPHAPSAAAAPQLHARRGVVAAGGRRREARRAARQPSAQRTKPAVALEPPVTVLPRVPAPAAGTAVGAGVRYAAQPRLPLQPAAGAGAVSSKMAASIVSFRAQHPHG